ncbi:MAG: hypothetical protein SFX74_03365 [Fimbriimonadaceae bacterium]|nr:hypothetical protein [Fimbriimonadaceae bacterium]
MTPQTASTSPAAPSPALAPTAEEQSQRRAVLSRVLEFIHSNRTIKLPPLDPTVSRPSDTFALVNIGHEPNEFAGSCGPFRYQFEGEEDLLHLLITRPIPDADPAEIAVAEGQAVAAWVLDGVPPALVWLKPGNLSIHFYVGHDDLIGNLKV